MHTCVCIYVYMLPSLGTVIYSELYELCVCGVCDGYVYVYILYMYVFMLVPNRGTVTSLGVRRGAGAVRRRVNHLMRWRRGFNTNYSTERGGLMHIIV
jgi:hypothetical protein